MLMTEVTKEVTFCCQSVNQDKHDTRVFIIFIAFEQALRGALAAGLEKEWNLNSTSNLPVAPRRLSCEIFANQLEVETSANVKKNIEKHVPMVMTSLLMSSPPISISHRLCRCRYSISRNVVASSPSFSRPADRVARRAYSQAIIFYFLPRP